MTDPNNKINSEIEELLPQTQSTEGDHESRELSGKFQELSSLGGHLGLYQELTNPSKEELLSALQNIGVRSASEEGVYDFLQVKEDVTIGFIRSKSGDWIEQDVSEYPDRDLRGGYTEYTRLASFFELYDRYGLDRPSANQLREAVVNFGVRDHPDEDDTYIATIEDSNGEEHRVGVEVGEVTVAYPIDTQGHRIGDDEYTRELLPKLIERLGEESESQDDVEDIVPPLPDQVENLLENESVAENYQLIMHRLAEQASGDVSEKTRRQKLAEARFITEVLSGERTWE